MMGGNGNGGGVGMSMDIWSTGDFSFESPLKDLLDSGDYTLEQLLAEDELLQELRGLHPVLMQYFSTERNLTKLLLYVTQQMPPPSSLKNNVASVEKHEPQQQQQQQQQHETTPVNGNREVLEDHVVVKTETMTNDDGGVEAVASSSTSSSAVAVALAIPETEQAKVEPGKWLLAQLEKKPSMDNNSITIDHDEDYALKKKHPELDPEMLYIRFPFMACEIICCELESVIETLVSGHAVLDDNNESMTNTAHDDDPATAVSSPPPQAVHLKNISTAQAAGHGSEGVEVLQQDNIIDPAAVSPRPTSPAEEEQHQDKASPPSNDDHNVKDLASQPSPSPPQPRRLLDLLFAVLYDTPAGQLDDYRAGYFDKILTVLFRKRPAVMRQYINSGGSGGGGGGGSSSGHSSSDDSVEDNEDFKKKKMYMMTAMMRHLYSQSIMQIAQRLLLPPRPVAKNAASANNSSSENDEAGGGENNASGGADVDSSSDPAVVVVSGGGGRDRGNGTADDSDANGQDILTGEEGDDDDEDDEEGENGAGIKCDWSKSTEALDLLLERLLHPDVDLDSGNVASSSSSSSSPISAARASLTSALDLELQEEQRLAMSLNASEVLITIIQNSLLSSETMLRLTSVETLQRLTEASTTVTATYKKKESSTGKEGEEQKYFSPHESLLTSAMNVIESLILQLGGYGAVGTMAILTPEEELAAASAATAATAEDSEAASEVDQGVATTMPAVAATASSSSSSNAADHAASSLSSPLSSPSDEGDGVDDAAAPLLIADLNNLLLTLPEMLDGFARLLRHPSTESWTSCMQFSTTQPVQLLGTSRLRIVRVLESLVLLGDPNVDSVLVQSDCLKTCLELFWEFPWCSMLHQSVANLLVHVFEGQNVRFEIQEYFLQECNLMGRLMDSFVESIDSSTDDAGTPATAPPTAADDDDGAAQPKPRVTKSRSVEGVGDGGKSKKGMSSVVMDLEKAVSNANATSAMAKAALAALMTPDAAAALRAAEEEVEAVVVSDRLPVSEDDVDAALEQQQEAAAAAREEDVEMASTEAVQQESQDGMSTSLIGAPAQSFRLGYMGHVIIICQALVQACSNDWASVAGGTDQGNDEMTQQSGDAGEGNRNKSNSSGASQNSASVGETTEGTGDLEALLIAELVNNHALTDRWQDFVATTLSSEIAIQSTPLGGMSNGGSVTGGIMTDLLSQRFGGGADAGSGGRRPGLADDDGDMMGGDGGAAPPPPPRGIYGGGDIIDMDDNDLEVAASMMARLGLVARPGHGKKTGSKRSGSLTGIRSGGGDDDDVNSGEFSGSGDSEKSYNSGETASEKGYLFDDPLGMAGGLGIELGKLTQYKRGGGESGDDGATGKDKDDDVNSSSSSSQEAPRDESDKDESDNDDEDEEDNVPVMDLFAGNFHHGGHESPGDGKPDEGNDDAGAAFDFANFASAFESGDTGGGGGGSFNDSTGALMDGSVGGDESEVSAKSSEIDAIFGEGDHSGLLEEDDLPEDPYATTTIADAPSENKEERKETARPATEPEWSTESSADVVAKDEQSPEQQEEEARKEDAWTLHTAFDDISDIYTAPSDELKADAKSFPAMSFGVELTPIDAAAAAAEGQTASDDLRPTEAPGDKPAAVESDTSGDIP
jgi:hypothetical protein